MFVGRPDYTSFNYEGNVMPIPLTFKLGDKKNIKPEELTDEIKKYVDDSLKKLRDRITPVAGVSQERLNEDLTNLRTEIKIQINEAVQNALKTVDSNAQIVGRNMLEYVNELNIDLNRRIDLLQGLISKKVDKADQQWAVNEIEKNINSLNERVARLINAGDQSNEITKVLQTQLDELKTLVATLQGQVNPAKLKELEKRINELTGLVENQRKYAILLTQRIKKDEEQVKELSTEIQKLNRQIQGLVQQMTDAIKKDEFDKATSNINTTLEDLKKNIKKLDSSVSSSNKENKEIKQTIQELKDSLTQIERAQQMMKK
jgi:chromosome segregation ATPase